MMTDDNELREEVTNFLRRNFPQIQMHGGSALIEELDTEEGSVSIRLGGACSGCGISPMTTQAIKTRLPDAIDGIETVHVSAGMDGSEGMAGGTGMNDPTPRRDSDDGPQAPF